MYACHKGVGSTKKYVHNAVLVTYINSTYIANDKNNFSHRKTGVILNTIYYNTIVIIIFPLLHATPTILNNIFHKVENNCFILFTILYSVIPKKYLG